MKPMPPLLTTYEEARLLLEARGHGLAKATERLQAISTLKGFGVSHASFSKKTTGGCSVPIEPEVAKAVEDMKAQGWYERRGEIVEAGLRAVHGDPPLVDVPRLASDLREYLTAGEMAAALAASFEVKVRQGTLIEEVACGIADRLRATRLVEEIRELAGRLTWKQVAIPAGVAAAVVCLAFLAARLIPDATPAASSARPLVIIADAGAGGAPVRFDPESLLAMSTMGEKPLDQPIPVKLLPGQKAPPCDSGVGEEAINAGCWIGQTVVKPPCGRLFRHGDRCYRPIAADPQKPVHIAP